MSKPVTAVRKPAPAPEAVIVVIEEAIANLIRERVSLQGHRQAAMQLVLDDPEGAATRVEEIDTRLAAIDKRCRTLEDAKIQRDAAQAEASRTARIAASSALRTSVMARAAARCAPGGDAEAVDAAFDATLAAVVRYIKGGAGLANDLTQALSELYKGDHLRLHDTLCVAGSRAAGNGPEPSVAVLVFIRKLLAIFGENHLADHVQLNPFSPKAPTTMVAASTIDSRLLHDRLDVR